MIKRSKLDFTGQPIYVGLDVHKKSWSVSISTQHGEYKSFSQPPEADNAGSLPATAFSRGSVLVGLRSGLLRFLDSRPIEGERDRVVWW